MNIKLKSQLISTCVTNCSLKCNNMSNSCKDASILNKCKFYAFFENN